MIIKNNIFSSATAVALAEGNFYWALLSKKETINRYFSATAEALVARVKPRRNEDNFLGALLLKKGTIK
jgi:hypothetical protein